MGIASLHPSYNLEMGSCYLEIHFFSERLLLTMQIVIGVSDNDLGDR